MKSLEENRIAISFCESSLDRSRAAANLFPIRQQKRPVGRSGQMEKRLVCLSIYGKSKLLIWTGVARASITYH